MKRMIKGSLVLLVIGALGFGAWFVLKLKRDYDAFIAGSPKPLIIAIETERLVKLRHEVEAGRWRVPSQSVFDELDGLLRDLGLKPGIEGLSEFYAYQAPVFDWHDLDKNKRSVIITMLRSMLMTKTDDGIFHVTSDGKFGALFVSDELLYFYQETDQGNLSGLMTDLPEAADPTEPEVHYPTPVF